MRRQQVKLEADYDRKIKEQQTQVHREGWNGWEMTTLATTAFALFGFLPCVHVQFLDIYIYTHTPTYP